MAKDTQARYGQVARTVADDFLVTGRYASQREAWPRVVADVLAKLRLTGAESLLDIGSGTGLLTLPLAEHARQVWALDQADVVARLAARAEGQANVTCLPGDFLTVDFGPRRFDRVLSYGVVLCLPDLAAVDAFVDKAIGLLAPGGLALIGDLPNEDRKSRFLSTEFGRRFDEEFRRRRAAEPESAREGLDIIAGSEVVGSFRESYLLGLVTRLRAAGLDASLLYQPGDLCFGWTREDLVVSRLPE
ncbi:MAG TPA: class I SAM-dependent methyltransferase [Vicinamibacteria bacterium]|nr:class I SAM-dependent methyltransferase [Vicinamibacteria bacterium]